MVVVDVWGEGFRVVMGSGVGIYGGVVGSNARTVWWKFLRRWAMSLAWCQS